MLSDTYKNKFLDSVLGVNASVEMPTSVWVGFLDVNNVECTGTGYARIEVANNGTNFPGASAGTTVLNIDVDFAAVGAADWGSMTQVGLWDQLTGGNLIASARIAGAVIGPWPAGIIPHIPAGNLKFAYR
jgi:hypothetical protein